MSAASRSRVSSIAKVVLDSPLPQLDRLFDYAVPAELSELAQPGVRVTVPLRSAGRVVNGFIVELADSAGYQGTLSDIESVVSPIPVLTPEVWTLARKASERAAGNAIDIVRLAVPARQLRIEKTYVATPETADAEAIVAPPIAGYRDGVIESGIAERSRMAVDAIPGVAEVSDGVWVGKWAVTVAAAAALTLSRGETAIIAVPDYRDLEQLAAALGAIIPVERIIRVDAKQPNPSRYREFLRSLEVGPYVIIGNRSAVYSPAVNLGLIVIWDDGDPLHSEPLSPYVHSRDAALLRQEQQDCALIFIGNTRSTEVERLSVIGWANSISPVPALLPRIIPTAQQESTDRLAAQARIPPTAWREATKALETGPVLVQVSRPGYAPRLACADCQQGARCMVCGGPLLKKSEKATPSCAWCGALAVGWNCNNCGGEHLRLVGSGSTRTAEDLGRAFPKTRIIVADGEHPVLSVGAEPALVIATRGAEPIAAGGYAAVILLDGESMFARESLRVGEDCLRWWSNAAALAAVRAPVVLVGVGGALAIAFATWRQTDYARAEVEDRRTLRFPPAIRVATVTGSRAAVTEATDALPLERTDILGPVDVRGGTVRSIVRFDYSRGAEIASLLKAEIVRAATTTRKPTPGKGAAGRSRLPLRVRFDDVEPFIES
jgi:primosomal protein N' (replication factor Y) (superfamily II helicase)